MVHLNLPQPLFIILLSVVFSIVLLSPVNSLAVPSDAFSSSAEPKSQRVHSRRQGPSSASSARFSLSAHPSTHPSKDNSSPVQFPIVTPSGSVISLAIGTHIQGLSIEENGNPWANGTVELPAGVRVQPWDESKYHNSTITTTNPELVKTTPSNVTPTSQFLVTVNQISIKTVPTNSTSLYLLAVPLAPKIDFSRPTPTPSGTTLDVKTGPQWASSEMHHMSVPKWGFRPRPIITGVTIHPTSIPENLISTFFGDLGWARTKGYVIPVDSNGISGWRRGVATEGPRSLEGFVRPNQVSGPMAGPSFPGRLQVPSMNSSAPQKTISPTSNSNITYQDNLKIAAIQAFAQLGVVLLAVLVVVVGAVTFTCFSSILRWPMKVVHAVRYRDADMLRDAFVPTMFRKRKGRRREKQERVDESGGFVRDAGVGKSYWRGTAEAVIFDGVESSMEGSSRNPSFGGFSTEPSESAMSFSTGTTVEATHDQDISLTVAVVNTGSQSKAEGGRLRIMNQDS